MPRTLNRKQTDGRTGKRPPPAQRRQTIATRIGRLVQLGTNEWGKPLVQCPHCGGTATTGRTGEVWCHDCGFTTVGLSGCG
ncbi:MAG: hypothetical protein WCF84_13770 [Anaerolineae bacterium]